MPTHERRPRTTNTNQHTTEEEADHATLFLFPLRMLVLLFPSCSPLTLTVSSLLYYRSDVYRWSIRLCRDPKNPKNPNASMVFLSPITLLRRAASSSCQRASIRSTTIPCQIRWLSTAHGYYYSDEKESSFSNRSKQKPNWITKLDNAVLRYPPSSSSTAATAVSSETRTTTTRTQLQPLDLDILAAGTGGHAVLGPNAVGKSLLSNALAFGSWEGPDEPHLQLPPSWLLPQCDAAKNEEEEEEESPPPLQHNHGTVRPSVARVSFESHQALLDQQQQNNKDGGCSVYQALTPDGGVLSKAAQFLVVRFGLYSMLSRQVHTLSTGEIRKVLLIRALSRRPKLLILDNAFDGLDVASREVLKELVSKTIAGFRTDVLVQGVDARATAHTQVLLMTHRAPEIVDEISRVTLLQLSSSSENGGVVTAVTEDRDGRSGEELLARALCGGGGGDDDAEKGEEASLRSASGGEPWDDDNNLPSVDEIAELWRNHHAAAALENENDSEGEKDRVVVHLENFCVTTKDGEKELISNLDWKVQQGERWLVAGGNGAGKSTLSRSLAYSEQAVAKEGSLKVTVESENVGWVSTERHMHMARSAASARAILLGTDNNVSCGPVSDEVGDAVATWLNLRNEQLARPFAELSQGEQKMVLIGSAVAKLPRLLIIDEPLQALDKRQRHLVLGLVERLCRATDISVIYVTHHFEEIVPSVSHVIHLKDGKSVFSDVVSAYSPDDF